MKVMSSWVIAYLFLIVNFEFWKEIKKIIIFNFLKTFFEYF